MRICFLCLLLCIVSATTIDQPVPPPIPQAFSSAFTVSIDLLPTNPFLAGQVAVNYPKNETLLYWSDSGALGHPPFFFQTTEIVHPQNEVNSTGYQFLSEGRCWSLGNISTAELEVFPLEVPAGSELIRNETIEGRVYGVWTWNYGYAAYNFDFEIAVRWDDGGVGFFTIHSTFLIPITLSIYFQNFEVGAPAQSTFDIPPGPCPIPPVFEQSMKSGYTYSSLNVRAEDLTRQSETSILTHLYKSIIHVRRMLTVLKLLENPAPSPSDFQPGAPTPPTLHQYFSANYLLGEGILDQSNNWQPRIDAAVGFIALDKEMNGAYMSVNDDEASNVPFQFTTSAILSPLTPGSNTSTFYSFLAPGRCWDYGLGLWASPNIPLTIPSNATYNGTITINGKTVSLWSFFGSFEGFPGVVVFAVSQADNSIVFINVESSGFGSVLQFTNFNAQRPPAGWYAAPPPPCAIAGQLITEEDYMLERIVATYIS